ncbi:MAG TPA: UDP-N-acetylmuramoyl-L-alanine--D-glutamate ligase [Syntrophobacteraceae bacterium]|nr:UDP-N-acetylmuramoyl-L-alanine--D-glutamate ligase [Syntrophobacteraceae bacterium]
MSKKSFEKTLVVGLGKSGQAVCALLLSRGAAVTATDLRPRSEFNGALNGIEEAGCSLRLGSHRLEDFLEADRIVVSPGVRLDIEPLEAARRRGIEIVGELEWACRQVSLPVIAVTGTNGKTTTTALIGEMFEHAGIHPFVGGNIGSPLSQWIFSGERADVLVLELSSFQLDSASTFRPDIGVLLNITEDHLDRYESFKAYADSKLSLFRRQSNSDFAIINADDPVCGERIGQVPGRVLFFGGSSPASNAVVAGGAIKVAVPGKAVFEISLEKTRLPGSHNRENIMAACLAAACMEIGAGQIQEAVDGFCGFAHRVEWVRNWKGIDFYDDSKATNVGAVVKALEGFDRPVLLLLGGRDKLGAYQPLLAPLTARGKGVFAFGEAGPRIYDELCGKVPAGLYPDLESAFRDAIDRALPGDVVLLSPACASFDQYESYAHRGDHFKNLVAQLED